MALKRKLSEDEYSEFDDEDCPVDEYSIFKDVLGAIQGSNPQWYAQLTSHLSENQGKALTEVITLANQRLAAKESKVIEQQGGGQIIVNWESRVVQLDVEEWSEELLAPALLCHKEPARASKAPY